MTHSFEIIPRAPYSFDFTVARFMRFATENVDLVEGGRYRRLLAAGRQIALATVTNEGAGDAAKAGRDTAQSVQSASQGGRFRGTAPAYPLHRPRSGTLLPPGAQGRDADAAGEPVSRAPHHPPVQRCSKRW